MAKMTISGGDEIELMLARLEAGSFEIGKKAVREAADIVADRMRSNIDKLPKDTFRKLSKEEEVQGYPRGTEERLTRQHGRYTGWSN